MKPKQTKKQRISTIMLFLFVAWVVVTAGEFIQDTFFSPTNAGEKYPLTGRVVHVADGDTLTIRAGMKRHTIRIASIDAPETQGKGHRLGQPYGRKSKRALHQLVHNTEVDLLCYVQDHYGRDVCDVFIECSVAVGCNPDVHGQQTTVSRVLVKVGLAWANQEKKGKFLRDDSLLELQSKAQQQKLGIWQDKKPIAPWV